jgi:GR25 family glycosyltransferase involved in LPS biosynthesis
MFCIDHVDAILYINLEHRKDRQEHMLNEIRKIDPILQKVHRINAVWNPALPELGCSLSHIQALKHCLTNPTWTTCMILEDDFTFSDDADQQIKHLLESLPVFDVLLLGTAIWDFHAIPTSDPMIRKVNCSQSASGYIVHRSYLQTLLTNFEESAEKLKTEGRRKEWCLDQYWKKLMPQSNWYTHRDRLGFQYANYSDIEKQVVNYNC